MAEFTQQRIGLADTYGTSASVSVDGEEGDRTIQLRVEIGQCGAAQAGSDLSDGHKHARALRLVAKTFLRDLWAEARRVQKGCETQEGLGPAPELQGATS